MKQVLWPCKHQTHCYAGSLPVPVALQPQLASLYLTTVHLPSTQRSANSAALSTRTCFHACCRSQEGDSSNHSAARPAEPQQSVSADVKSDMHSQKSQAAATVAEPHQSVRADVKSDLQGQRPQIEPSKIPCMHTKDLSYEAFVTNFMEPNVPVMIQVYRCTFCLIDFTALKRSALSFTQASIWCKQIHRFLEPALNQLNDC